MKNKRFLYTFKQLLSLEDRTFVNDYILEKIEYLKNRKQDLINENKELLDKYEELMADIGLMEEDMLYYVRLTEKINNDLLVNQDDAQEIYCLYENEDFFENEDIPSMEVVDRLKLYFEALSKNQIPNVEPLNVDTDDKNLCNATKTSIDYLLDKEKWYTTENNVFQRRKAKNTRPHYVNKIIAVDFDGTLCENKYPSIGKPNHRLIRQLRHLQKNNTLILWTCRNGDALLEAIKFCENYGLMFNYINENTKEVLENYGGIDNRKITADIYIDDKARCCL